MISYDHLQMDKVVEWSTFLRSLRKDEEDREDMEALYQAARNYLEYHTWCREISESYLGFLRPGIIGVFLFKIVPAKEEVDEWIWIIVGDIPPVYMTTEICPNPAIAVEEYIFAMRKWVEAARNGETIEEMVPVNAPPTKENAEALAGRLRFIEERILSQYADDLKS